MLNLEEVKKEYETILNQLSDPGLISNWEKGDESKDSSSPFAGARVFEELLKRKVYLEKIIEKGKEIKEIKKEIEENKAILLAKEGPELISLAEEEIRTLNEKQKFLEKELAASLEASLAPAGRENSSAVIVEIRAGTGGKEAALFAAELLRMYLKCAQSQNWKEKILDSHQSELGGLKEVIFELTPGQRAGLEGDVWSRLKFEGGVHRVQRIPETEKSGRIHTSTATVAVLPKPKKAEIKINPQDLKIDFYRASGPGGQYVNKRETAVRITHLPTGIVVTSQTERNQLQNRENAMSILEARLSEKKRMEAEEKVHGKRRSQIKWAKRAEKIRTYNFPQDRVTDHRVKKSWHNIEDIMNGKLEPIVEALRKAEFID